MKRRRLTGDEDALWRRATRDVRRIKSDDGPTPFIDAAAAPPAIRPPGRMASAPSGITMTDASARRGKTKTGAAQSAFEAGDPGADRRIRRGRRRIERKLDLHGLTQAAAHVRLSAFIEGACRDGLYCVLVVTGKGGAADIAQYTEERPRGVLKRRFRQWVDEPPLRGMIARVSEAQQKDGGGGAFYVFLKSGPAL